MTKCVVCRTMIEEDSLFTQICKKCSGQKALEIQMFQEGISHGHKEIDEQSRQQGRLEAVDEIEKWCDWWESGDNISEHDEMKDFRDKLAAMKKQKQKEEGK